jgi:hypothetical protein
VSGPEPTREELRAQLEEQMKRITVEDVIVQTVVTLVNLGGRRLGLAGDPSERDIEQARQAIEGVRALVPLMPGDEASTVRDALSQLQFAYAREARSGAAPASAATGASPGPEPGGEAPPGRERPSPDEEAERAKARARIWTPPGS